MRLLLSLNLLLSLFLNLCLLLSLSLLLFLSLLRLLNLLRLLRLRDRLLPGDGLRLLIRLCRVLRLTELLLKLLLSDLLLILLLSKLLLRELLLLSQPCALCGFLLCLYALFLLLLCYRAGLDHELVVDLSGCFEVEHRQHQRLVYQTGDDGSDYHNKQTYPSDVNGEEVGVYHAEQHQEACDKAERGLEYILRLKDVLNIEELEVAYSLYLLQEFVQPFAFVLRDDEDVG